MPSGLRQRVWTRWAAALIAAVLLTSLVSSASAENRIVNLQILDVSDWHAQLDPLSGVGGAAQLSTYFKQERALNPNTLTVTAGDAFGAAPPLSGFFNEEPGVLSMRLMGIDVDTFGNHNFDRGTAHLQRMINLAGASPLSAPGRPFTFVSANLQNLKGNLAGVKPYKIFEIADVKVAVVGITNPEAPTLVFPGNFGTIVISDPVAAANSARAEARRKGAKIVIAITHMGVTGTDASGAASGPLITFANQVTGYDLVIGDHTDTQYQGFHNGALVFENKSKGVTYARTKIAIDKKSGRILSRTLDFVAPTSAAVTPDPAIVGLLQPYRVDLAAQFDAKVGVANDRFPRGGNVERSGEVAIGNFTADSMRWRYGTQLALTNGGGLRSPLPSSYAPLATGLSRAAAPFDLVVGDAYTVLPFGNSIVTRNVTGAQLWAALENGVSQINATTCLGTDGRFPQISGFTFAFSCSALPGSRVSSVALDDGTPIPADGTVYSFATNDFVNAGGDSYLMFKDGQGSTREVMADVFLEYIKAQTPISPTLTGRITKLP